jgi:hypothetical protein
MLSGMLMPRLVPPISKARSRVVTTIFGRPGLQYGTRPVTLPDNVEEHELTDAVTDVWTGIIDLLKADLDPKRRRNWVVAAPGILAGIGVVAHQTMPAPPRRRRREAVDGHRGRRSVSRRFLGEDGRRGAKDIAPCVTIYVKDVVETRRFKHDRAVRDGLAARRVGVAADRQSLSVVRGPHHSIDHLVCRGRTDDA